MRLSLFIHSMGGGGAERVVTNLANYWASIGWDVTVLTLGPRSLDAYECHPAVKRVALDLAGSSGNIASGLWQNVRRVIALRRALRDLRPDVTVGMMTTANVLLAIATIGLPLLAIGSEHVHPPQYPLGPIWEGLRRFTYCRLGAVTALTSESGEWLKAHTNAVRVTVIPNAAPWPLPAQEPSVDPESVCSAGRRILLGVGRLEDEKGFDQLLKAFAGITQKHVDWDLVILGEGSSRTMLEAQIRAAGMNGRAFLPGRVGNVAAWYDRADLYVLSSHYEGFGNTVAEALAYGLPVVSFDCDTGPRNIVRHGVDGLLVPPGDVSNLAAALDRLMGDAELRERFAMRAVDARTRFSIDRIAGMWEVLFATVSRDSR